MQTISNIDHLLLHEHNNRSFNDFSVLCCEDNAFKLSLRESILIKRDSPEVNRNACLMPLLLFNQLLYNHQWNIDHLFYIYDLKKRFWFHFVKEFVWSWLQLFVESLQINNNIIWNFSTEHLQTTASDPHIFKLKADGDW